MKNKIDEKIFFLIIFLYLFLINYFQFVDQPWFKFLDMDIVVIYNSLLISNGFEQDYLDHPGYSYFIILGILFKILSFFMSSELFSLKEIINSENPSENIQLLFQVSRIFNLVICFINIFFIFKIFKIFKINKILNYSLLIITLILPAFLEVNFKIRVEGISALFYLMGLYFILQFYHFPKMQYIILSGVIFLFAYLSKIQIIFHYISIFFLISYYATNVKNIGFNNLKFNYLKFVPFIFIIVYFLLNILLIIQKNEDPAIYFNLFFNLIVVLFGLIIFVFILKIFFNYSWQDFLNFNYLLSLFFIGTLIGIIFLLLLDLSGLLKFNYKIFISLLLPFYHMVQFTAQESFNISAFQIISSINVYQLFLLISYFVLLILYFSKKNLRNSDHFEFIFVSLMCLTFFIVFISNIFRGIYFYYIYIIIIFPLSIFLNKKLKLIYLFQVCTVGLLLYNIFILGSLNNYFSHKEKISNICKNSEARSFIKTWNKKFDEKFLKKICY